MRISSYPLTYSVITLSVLFCASPVSEASQSEAVSILREGRDVASTIKDHAERTTALDHVVFAQIGVDPPGARSSIKLIPDLLNAPNHLASLAFNYAKVGDVQSAQEIYAELLIRSGSNLGIKLARANALGHVAWAHANAGQFEEAYRQLDEIKKQYKGENYAIVWNATASIAEAQAKHGNVAQAIEMAKTVDENTPYPLMHIVGGLIRTSDMPRVLLIVSGLKESLQQYAKWGIVTAQIELNNLEGAHTTAHAIKPGHAKANALMELANHYRERRDKATARTLLEEATVAALSTINNWTRADILWHIAASTANAGDGTTALKIAKSIEKDGHKRFAIRDIAKAQAEQGAFKDAFDTADLLQQLRSENSDNGTETYIDALSDILTQMVRANRTKEARESVARLDGLKAHRAPLYSAIAAAQADADDVQGARVTLSYAETDAQRAARRKEMTRLVDLLKQRQGSEELRQLRVLQTRESDTLPALEAIALAWARKGFLAEASNIANDLDFHKRSDLYKEIGNRLVVSAGKSEALRWARTLSASSDKAYALVGIASAIFSSEQKNEISK